MHHSLPRPLPTHHSLPRPLPHAPLTATPPPPTRHSLPRPLATHCLPRSFLRPLLESLRLTASLSCSLSLSLLSLSWRAARLRDESFLFSEEERGREPCPFTDFRLRSESNQLGSGSADDASRGSKKTGREMYSTATSGSGGAEHRPCDCHVTVM